MGKKTKVPGCLNPSSTPCTLFPYPPPLPDTEYPIGGKTTLPSFLPFPSTSLPLEEGSYLKIILVKHSTILHTTQTVSGYSLDYTWQKTGNCYIFIVNIMAISVGDRQMVMCPYNR